MTSQPLPTFPDAPPTQVRFRVLAFFCAAAAIAYLQRTVISVAAPSIRRDLALSEIEMGWVMSGFYWAYALFQIPAGGLGQRWGSRRALVVAMTVTSLLCALVALCGGFWQLSIVWMGVGLAIAGIFPSCAQSIQHWFPPTGRALPSGFLLSSMSIGAMLAAALTGFLLSLGESTAASAASAETSSAATALPSEMWRGVFALYALPGLLWAILFALWFRNRPEGHPSVNAAELELIQGGAQTAVELADHSRRTPWRQLLSHPKMQLICGQQFLRAAGYVFYATWFPTYLREVYGVTTLKSGYLTSVPLLGVVLGGFIAGPICDLLLKRTGSLRLSLQLVGVLSQFVSSLLILLAWFVDDSTVAIALIGSGSFVFSFGSCTAYAVTIQLSQPYVAPVFSTMNMSGNFGAAICPLVVGWLAVRVGWPPVLLFFAGIYLLSGLCWLALDPNGNLFHETAPAPTP